MKYLFLHIISLFIVLVGNAQNCEEYKTHIKSIDSIIHTGGIPPGPDGSVVNINSKFVQHVIDELLINPEDSCFIANRQILNKLEIKSCNNNQIIMDDTLSSGEHCSIMISIGDFKPSEHSFDTNIDTSSISKIDGQKPYGGFYAIPYTEIKSLDIRIDGKSVEIPKEAYSNFYDLSVCDNLHFVRQIEAYESLNGEFIYIYLYGGANAGTYFGKIIFSHDIYITKIVSTYYSLSTHASFRKNFIGF